MKEEEKEESARGDKVTRKSVAAERGQKMETEEHEGRGAAGGDGRLIPLAPGRTHHRCPAWFRCVREKVVVRENGERTTRVPEVSGGYSVIMVPSREPTNQTKRDKDKQRFEPTEFGRGKE